MKDFNLDENTCAFCKHVKVILGSAGCLLDGKEKEIFCDTCEKFEYGKEE